MSKLLYKVINPIVKTLLRSPAHGLMSSNTLLLEFVGRKSGRTLTTPISYHLKDNVAHCFTAKEFQWWRNLTGHNEVKLTIRGKTFRSKPEVETGDATTLEQALYEFLIAVPRDAAHSGVELDQNGIPLEVDIKRATTKLVYLKFPLEPSND